MALLAALACLASCTPDRVDVPRAAPQPTVAETPLESEEVERLRAFWVLGVGTRPVGNRSTARELGLPPVIRGALVLRVIPGPAARAGIKRGDVIVEIRVGRGADEVGYHVGSTAQLESVLTRLKDLDRFRVEVFRGPAPLNRSSYATRLFPVRLKRG